MSTQTELYIVSFIFLASFWVLFSTLVSMARERGQSPLFWLVMSAFWSPFVSIVLLWVFYRRRPAHKA